MRAPYRFFTTHRTLGGPPVWLALVDEEASVYVWSPDLGRFVFHDVLTGDLSTSGQVALTPVSPDEAARICASRRVGKLNDHLASALDRLRAEKDVLDPGSVLPALEAPIVSRSQQAAAVLLKEPGRALVYMKYPIEKLSSARRAASDIRNGRVRGFVAVLGERFRDLRTEIRRSGDGRHALLLLLLADESLSVGAKPSSLFDEAASLSYSSVART